MAQLTVLGVSDPLVIKDWLANGVAVLELQTRKGIFLATGNPGQLISDYRDLTFHRIAELAYDPRSDLRVSPFSSRVVPKETLASQLGRARGIYGIDHMALVFSHDAVAQIKLMQGAILAASLGDAVPIATEIHMTFCFKHKELHLQRAKRISYSTVLANPGDCDA